MNKQFSHQFSPLLSPESKMSNNGLIYHHRRDSIIGIDSINGLVTNDDCYDFNRVDSYCENLMPPFPNSESYGSLNRSIGSIFKQFQISNFSSAIQSIVGESKRWHGKGRPCPWSVVWWFDRSFTC